MRKEAIAGNQLEELWTALAAAQQHATYICNPHSHLHLEACEFLPLPLQALHLPVPFLPTQSRDFVTENFSPPQLSQP